MNMQVEDICKVLIVEDEYGIRKGIQNLIDWPANGFSIVGEAGNGKEALDMIEAVHPHIVITDILMPIMNGVEMAKIIHTHYPSIRVVVLSGYSDYDYVRTAFQYGAVDYILKPMLNKENLLALLQKTAVSIPGMILKRCYQPTKERLLEAFFSGVELQEQTETFIQQFPGPSYMMLGMDVQYALESPRDLDRYNDLLSETAEKYMEGLEFNCIVLEDKIIMIIVSFQPAHIKKVRASLENVAEQFAAYCGDAFFVCSTMADGLSELKQIYQKHFSDLLNQRFYYKDKHFICSQDFKQPDNVSAMNKHKFTELLQQGKIKEAVILLSEAVYNVVQLHSMEEMELKSLVQNAVYQILEAWKDTGVDGKGLSSLKRKALMKISNVHFAEELIDIVNSIAEEISPYSLPQDSEQMNEILQYIREHYSEHITLTDLAKKFNFNYYYLSTYISTKFAGNFSEYLNNIRIDKAKQLLIKQDIPVAEVGSMVGYTDNSYFARVFKKGVGVTPREYRQKKTGGQ